MIECWKKHCQKPYSSRTSHSHTNEIFNLGALRSWSLTPFVISLFALAGVFDFFPSHMELSVKLQRKWSCSRKTEGDDGCFLQAMRFHQIKRGGGGSRVLIMEQQLYSAEIVVELFCLSWRLVVVKHLRAKVLLFSSPFVSLCLSSSAQPWWLLLLMLSASFFLVVFSPNKPLLLLPETLNTSLPVHQSIFHQEDLPDFTKPWWGGYLWKRMSCQQTAVKGKSVMSTEQS